MIAIDLCKQQAIDADRIQQIKFTGNLSCKGNQAQIMNNNTTVLLIIEESKEAILYFSQGTVKVLWIYFTLI